MTDLSSVDFKTNVQTIVNKIIRCMDKNKMYIIIDDDWVIEDIYTDLEDRSYIGNLYWDNLVERKLSFYDSIKNIEIGNYRRIRKRMDLNLQLFDYLVETQEFWQNNSETNTVFRDIIYNKLTDYREDIEETHINIDGINQHIRIFGFYRDYGLTTEDFPHSKYFELLKFQCTFPVSENEGQICKNCTISNKNPICKIHNDAITYDKYIRSYVQHNLPLHNDVSNIVLDYLPMYKPIDSNNNCTIS
jgi:hypothetical protein